MQKKIIKKLNKQSLSQTVVEKIKCITSETEKK